MDISSIIPISVNPSKDQIAATAQDVIQSSQDIRKFTISSSKDMYAGSVSLNITYSDLARNNIKPRTSDITPSSNDIIPNSKDAFAGSRDYIPQVQDLAPSSTSIRIKTKDVMPNQSEITKSGDLRHQIVKTISEEVQKNIKKLDRYNLSKGNRLLKTIPENAV
jgi:hypothetical protein